MVTKTLVVDNETGLHARPASDLVKLAKGFESKIVITGGESPVNPKSIMSILKAGISKGTKIEITVEGPDEEQAGNELAEFISGLTE